MLWFYHMTTVIYLLLACLPVNCTSQPYCTSRPDHCAEPYELIPLTPIRSLLGSFHTCNYST